MLFPPNYHPILLHPSIPYLTAYLRSKGHEVVQKNLTPASYKFLMPDISDIIDSMRSSYMYGGNPQLFLRLKKQIEKTASEIQHKDRLFEIKRNTFNYIPRRDSTHLDQLLLAIEEKEDNLFYHFFEEEVLGYVEGQNPDLIGLGITDHKQFVPGMILASMIKEYFPDKKIVVGGHLISKTESTLISSKATKLFDYVDYLVFNEGELPLEMLVSALSNDGDVTEIPRLAYRKNATIKINNKGFPIINLDELATPTFDGFVEDQWTPEPYVPLILYRGCWKGRICKFCDLNEIFSGFAAKRAGELPKTPKRIRSLDKVVEDVKTLRAQGVKYFNFTDEWFVAKHLVEFSKKIITGKIDDIQFDWYGMIESDYTKGDNSRKIFQAGGRFAQFGVESRSEEILKKMDKGYKQALTTDVLKATSEAGIMNHVFVLVGYPTATVEEELLNIPFLTENKDLYHTEKTTAFRLSALSRLALDEQDAKTIGIRRNYGEGDLAVNAQYNGGVISHTEINALKECIDEVVKLRHPNTRIMGEFVYYQRLFVGLERLKEMRGEVSLPEQDVRKYLTKVWGSLVDSGRQENYAKVSRDIYSGNLNPKKLASFKRMQVVDKNVELDWKTNVRMFVKQYYPNGFHELNDLIVTSYYAKKCYKDYAKNQKNSVNAPTST